MEKPEWLKKIFHRASAEGPAGPDAPESSQDSPAASGVSPDPALSPEKKAALLTDTSHTTKRNLFRAVWNQYIKPYWGEEGNWKNRSLLATVAALNVSQVGLNLMYTHWNQRFYHAMQNYNRTAYNTEMEVFAGIAFTFIGSAIANYYAQSALQIDWRKWMTEKGIGQWLDKEKKPYHAIQQSAAGTTADNPDQRISVDTDSFTLNSLNLSMGLLSSLSSIGVFMKDLWDESSPLHISVAGHHMAVPDLVLASIAYSLLGNWLISKVGRKVIPLTQEQQRRDADFRAAAIRVRENAESIALYNGEDVEKASLSNKFNKVVQNFWQVMKKQKNVVCFQSVFGQTAVIAPFLMTTRRYFEKAVVNGQPFDLGAVFKVAGDCGFMQNAMSWLVNSFPQYADWKAAGNRLVDFTEAITHANENHDERIQPDPAARERPIITYPPRALGR